MSFPPFRGVGLGVDLGRRGGGGGGGDGGAALGEAFAVIFGAAL